MSSDIFQVTIRTLYISAIDDRKIKNVF
jgi:hypothetical protein